MRTYLLEIAVHSSFITPWHADTIFGHLCWVAERNNGFEHFKGAQELIEYYRQGSPPLLISDAFPSGYFPSPANLHEVLAARLSVPLTKESYAALKRIKKLDFIKQQEFQAYQQGESFTAEFIDMAGPILNAVTLHNQISRLSNTTGQEGSLFELSEMYIKDGKLTIFARLEEGFEQDAKRLFQLWALGGFGKKRTTGKGSFIINKFEPYEGLDPQNINSCNGFISLSHFIPAKHDPTEGAYKILVKFGKLGDEKALCGNPFKKPIIMLKPGAVFKTNSPRPYYGRLIENLAYADKAVVQYGYAFAVPITIS